MNLLLSASKRFSPILTIKMLILLFLTGLFINANAQNKNYRAQGYYYSAKAKLKSGAYQEAIDYVDKSKKALGGTNEELQYLHILAAYYLEDFEQSKKEMETFFDIGEKKVKPIYFDKDVDRLTTDETKQLTMLMDPIFESADKKKNHRCKKCTGTGKMEKTVYHNNNCNECGENDRGIYRISSGSTSSSNYTRKGYQRTEWRGYTKTTCKVCSGVGLTVCTRCEGYTYSKCKGCNNHPTNPSGYKGLSFFCSACSGSGYDFRLCTKCSGTKTYTTTTTEKVTCDACRGKGY